MKQFTSPHALAHCDPSVGVLLALSGGADSRALLHLLAADAGKHGYALHLAHVHHGIRGLEADRDEQRCRDLAAVYGCPIHVLHADIPALAKETGESLEMVGRRVRYDYFTKLMREHGLSLLATAHHADDHAETVLMRLLVGTSTTGLGGISPVQPFGNGYLVRPLLCATRADILAYCQSHALAYATDSTNADTAYLRNRIRAELMPVMEQIVPHPQAQLLRAGQLLREDDELLRSLSDRAFADAQVDGGALRIDALRSQPFPLQRRMLLRLIRDRLPDARIDACHMQALLSLVAAGHGMTDLPGNLRATADGSTLYLQTKQAQPLPPISLHLPLCEGVHHIDDLGVTLTVQKLPAQSDDFGDHVTKNQIFLKNPQKVYNPFIHDTLTFDTIQSDAYFRLRRDGDVLRLRGMHRSVRKLQNEIGMPPSLRCRLPMLCDGDGVLWLPFVGRRDAPPPTASSHIPSQCRYRITIDITTAPDFHS
ncbi:MAG: tRNA lysidine(34) synthetase TilS [Clostridia bacterium]|nr:tRNA lysidine(34) synthetase TilS [Clostridia bacterium]